MAVRHYSKDELTTLRDSPLVQKPDNLPAIEQWIEYVFVDKESKEKLRIPHSESQQAASATARRQPQSKAGGEASPMGNFSTGLRPSLMSTRSSNRGGEDISLGPPRTTFPSSRNVAKVSDSAEKTSGDADEQEAPRSRFFGDKANRKSVNEKEGRDNRESWTSARERRQMGGDDEAKTESRYNRRDREQDGERRNGYGERQESGWAPRDSRRQNGERQGGWRDRERDKRDRDWDRGPAEKEPEWMDDPTPTGADDDLRSMGMARNQEEFQKWKAAMSGKKVEEATSPEPAPPAKVSTGFKPAAALKLEGVVDKPFGSWGDTKPPGTSDTAAPATKNAAPKSKGSRFASIFKDQGKEETPPAEAPAPKAEEAAEDQAGFQRILQMLGGTGMSQPGQEGLSSPPQKSPANGTTKQKSRFTAYFDQTPKSPERMQSPPEGNDSDVFQGGRGLSDEPGSMFGGRLPDAQSATHMSHDQAQSNPISPEPMFPPNMNREQQQQSQPQRMSDIFIDQPPSRGAATPDNNIQNLLASQRSQRPQGQDKNFLLDLLQTKGSSRPSSQQARPENNFPLWLDQPPNMSEPHAPKPRAPPPPGLFEDQLLRNALQEQPRQDPQPMPGNEMPHRRTSQRAPPPGFYDEQSLFMQQQQQQAAQRRNFTEPAHQQQHSRRMSGHHNLPQVHIPQHHQQYQGPPPDFLQSPGSHQQAPPPGFNHQMPRHPPGFSNMPTLFGGPQQQSREPPGYPGGIPGSAGGMQSPTNAPPGFYGQPQGMPPGFMQMRSPTDGMSANGGLPPGNGREFPGPRFDGQMGIPYARSSRP